MKTKYCKEKNYECEKENNIEEVRQRYKQYFLLVSSWKELHLLILEDAMLLMLWLR